VEELVSLVELPDWKSILMDIVHKEGFDPWDIDVGALARAYLKRIQQMRELNLTVPANAVLACSILLSLKAKKLKEFYADWIASDEDAVLALPEPEPEPIFIPEAPSEADTPSREDVAPNVVVPQRIVPRRVTLDELISAVERIMLAKKKVRRSAPPPPVEEFFENMERDPVADLVDAVYERIKALASKSENKNIALEEILPNREPSTIVKHLLALLYLASQRKIVLHQEKPFGEIHIALPGEGDDGSKENN